MHPASLPRAPPDASRRSRCRPKPYFLYVTLFIDVLFPIFSLPTSYKTLVLSWVAFSRRRGEGVSGSVGGAGKSNRRCLSPMSPQCGRTPLITCLPCSGRGPAPRELQLLSERQSSGADWIPAGLCCCAGPEYPETSGGSLQLLARILFACVFRS